MSTINAKKLAAAIVLIIEAVGGTSSNSSVDEAEDGGEEETTTRGRGRPKGSTKKAPVEKTTKAPAKGKGKAKEEEEEDEEEEDDGLGGDEEEEDDGLGDDEEELTQEEVVGAFKALKASHGIEKCREVLAKIDESNALNIPPKKFADAMKEIKRAASRPKK